MRRKLKRFQVLIFALSMLMSFCFVYLQNDGVGKIHSVSSGLTLANHEIADQEGLGTYYPAPSKEFVSASSGNLSYQRAHSSQDLFRPSFQPSFLKQKLTILRC